jgi:hypothetical protein
VGTYNQLPALSMTFGSKVRYSSARVPAESSLTFRLEQPLEMGVADDGITRRGRHYHTPNR